MFNGHFGSRSEVSGHFGPRIFGVFFTRHSCTGAAEAKSNAANCSALKSFNTFID